MTKTCDDIFEIMNQIIDGDPDPKLASELDHHLTQCEACAELWEQMQETELWLHGLEDEPEAWLPVVNAPTGMATAALSRYKVSLKSNPTSIFSKKYPAWVRTAAQTGIAAAIIGVGIQYGVLQNPNDPLVLPEQLLPTKPPTPKKPEETTVPANSSAVASIEPSTTSETIQPTQTNGITPTDDSSRKQTNSNSGLISNGATQGGNSTPEEDGFEVIDEENGFDWDESDLLKEWFQNTPVPTQVPTVEPTQMVTAERTPERTPYIFPLSTKRPFVLPTKTPGPNVWYTLPPTARPTSYQINFDTPKPIVTERPATSEPTKPPTTPEPIKPTATPVSTKPPSTPDVLNTPTPTMIPLIRPTGTPSPTMPPYLTPQPMPTKRPQVIIPTPEATAEPLSTPTPATKVRITFLVDKCDVASGQYCAVVGSFNAWKYELKYRLEWKASLNRWYGVFEFDKNQSYDFKLVKVNESGNIVVWENGSNQKLTTGTSDREISVSWR